MLLLVELKEMKMINLWVKVVEYGVASNWFVVLSDCALEFY